MKLTAMIGNSLQNQPASTSTSTSSLSQVPLKPLQNDHPKIHY
jgi:hypothetical protein